MNAKDFTEAVSGNGIGITTNDSKLPLRIPRDAENKHFLIVGDTGSGKSSIIRQLLYQVNARGDSAIVYDPACEFVKQFYDERRGDIVLNPLDARMPYWNPSKELRRKAEAKALAVSVSYTHLSLSFCDVKSLARRFRESSNWRLRSRPVTSPGSHMSCLLYTSRCV